MMWFAPLKLQCFWNMFFHILYIRFIEQVRQNDALITSVEVACIVKNCFQARYHSLLYYLFVTLVTDPPQIKIICIISAFVWIGEFANNGFY